MVARYDIGFAALTSSWVTAVGNTEDVEEAVPSLSASALSHIFGGSPVVDDLGPKNFHWWLERSLGQIMTRRR